MRAQYKPAGGENLKKTLKSIRISSVFYGAKNYKAPLFAFYFRKKLFVPLCPHPSAGLKPELFSDAGICLEELITACAAGDFLYTNKEGAPFRAPLFNFRLAFIY